MPLPFLIAAISSALAGAASTAAAAGAAVAGAAAATGAAVAGTAAAAGTAIASTAVGGAVIGAATTAGTAIATSAVGTAVGGALGAVGAGVGAAAGAASALPVVGGLASTIAGIGTAGTAGATALGAVATASAAGAASGISGAAKMSQAKDVKNAAQSRYDHSKKLLEDEQKRANSALSALHDRQLHVFDSFNRFTEMYSKIQNPPKMEAEVKEDSLDLSLQDLSEIRTVAITARQLLKGGAGSAVLGAAAGSAATGLVGTLGTASTGAAISGLHGIAATNATMAALGGGSLAAGGAGMAGGAAMLSALGAAPAVVIGGVFLHNAGKKSLKDAETLERESEKFEEDAHEACVELKKLENLVDDVVTVIADLDVRYDSLMDYMEHQVEKEPDFRAFDSETRKKLERTTLTLKLLKRICTIQLLDESGEKVLEEPARKALQDIQEQIGAE